MNKRILVVDDNRLIVNLLRVNLLSAGYDVVTAADGFAALRMALSERPDLILLDVMMPEMDGFEVARQVRNNTLIAHVPIIMLTARGSVDSIIEGLDAGADDYISKPFEITEVLARIKAHLRRSRSERSLSPLTGLPGNITIEAELKQVAERNKPFAVIYADIDNFKSFNDVYGFLQGDEAIKLLASSILNAVQSFGNPQDFVGHIGGDDFVISTTPDRADGICQDVIRRYEEQVRSLYRPDHVEQGFVVGLSRDGAEVRHAIVTVSLAVVSNEHREIDSHWEIGEIAAELKRAAKQIGHSVYVKDLRSGRVQPVETGTQRTEAAPLPAVLLFSKDVVLRLVAPVSFKRIGLKLAVVDSLSALSLMEFGALIVDDDELTPEVTDMLNHYQAQGKHITILVSPTKQYSLSFDYAAKPWNISHSANMLRNFYNEPKEREHVKSRIS